MGFIGSLLSNDKGAGYQAGTADIAQPLGSNDVTKAFGQVNGGIDQQQAFIRAIQAQNGLGNQSSVFSQQQALANQLGQQAMGAGPNPALAQFNQATGQNVANQAALMAGVRGASSNPGLIARQAAQQGANIQQQAVGQGAVMQAQQQLAAQQALQAQQAQLAGLATNQVGQQAGAVSGLNQFAQGAQQNALAGLQGQNNANVAMQSNINNANSQIAQGNQKAQAGILGGLTSGLGIQSMLSGGGGAGGAAGGAGGGGSALSASSVAPMMVAASGGQVPGTAAVKGDSLKNDFVHAMLSPGEVVIPRHVMDSDDPAKGAAEFINQIMSKKKDPSDAKRGNFDLGGMAQFSPDQMTQGVLNGQTQVQIDPTHDAIQGGGVTGSWGPDVSGSGSPEMPIANSPSPEASSPSEIGSLINSFDEMKKGQKLEAQATAEEGKAQAGILGQQAKDLQAQDQKTNAAFRDLDAERQMLTQQVMEGKIDPHRYIGSMGTPQKLGTAIGLILGGIGAGINGGENPAMQYLNKQIENDIDAQKQDLHKKESLLSHNMQRFGNLRDATQMTRANMMDLASLQMKQKAAEAQDPLAKARLLQESGKLDMQAAQMIGPLKMKQQVLQGLATGKIGPEQAVPYIVPKEHQAKVFAEIEAAQNTQHMGKSILKSFEDAVKENTVMRTGAGLLRTPGSVSALHQSMQPTFKDLEGTVRQAAMDNTFKNITPAPGDSDHKIEQKRQALKEYLQSKMSAPTAKGFDLDLQKYQSTTQDPYLKLSPQQKQWADYARKNNDTVMLQKLGLQ